MNFSELFKQSNHLCKFSPNGQYLASCAHYRLVVRDVRTLQILQLYTCLDTVQSIEWSSDSMFILCSMYKRGIVQVWSLEQPEWTCKIDEGSAGLISARWSPDGRHILTTAEFHLRITVWSLVTKSVSYIKYPKEAKQGMWTCKIDEGSAGLISARWSPDGRPILTTAEFHFRITVWSLVTKSVSYIKYPKEAKQGMWTCKIDEGSAGLISARWSPDGRHILTTAEFHFRITVWSLVTKSVSYIKYPKEAKQGMWTCKIDEGSAGLISARWSPDGRHILTTAEFHLRITVWSLVTKSVSYIKYPKEAKQAMHFTKDGKYLALAERRDCKDFISVFACNTWQLVKHFDTNTRDLAGLEWSPDSRVLCVWDSILEYNLLLYSVDGRCLATFKAYEYALGIKSVAWSPSSQFLAIGSFDQKVRVLNHVTWKTVAEHSHPSSLDSSSVVIYKEIEKKPQLVGSDIDTWPPTAGMFTIQSKYEVVDGTVQIPTTKPDPDKANPRVGISLLSFSPDNRYMISKNDNMPNALWIWDVQKLSQAVLLLQVGNVRSAQWDPHQPRLALCTSSNKLYLWSPTGCVSVEVPAEASFQVNSLHWHPDGNAILLMSKDQMCVCFLAEDS